MTEVKQRDNSGQFTQGNEFAWQQGESGNPDGRPVDSLTTLLKEYLDADNSKEKRELIEVLVRLAKSPGIRGQISALREIFDRVEGKVPDKHQLEGLEAKVVMIQFVPADRLTENTSKQLSAGGDEDT